MQYTSICLVEIKMISAKQLVSVLLRIQIIEQFYKYKYVFKRIHFVEGGFKSLGYVKRRQIINCPKSI